MSNVVNPNVKRTYPVVADIPSPLHPIYKPHTLDIPNSHSVRDLLPPVWNQEQVDCCTAEAISGALSYYVKDYNGPSGLKIGNRDFYIPSVLFQYYNERKNTNTQNQNVGSTLYNTVQTVEKFGICEESMWPFVPANENTEPNPNCYQEAIHFKLNNCKKIISTDIVKTIKQALLEDYIVMIGVAVFPSMESPSTADTGIVPIPTGYNEPLGGHAVLLTGYNTSPDVFEFRNSWGNNWGDNGYGYFPYSYIEHYMISAWAIKS